MNYNIRFRFRTVARLAAAVAVLLLSASCNRDKHEVLVERPISMTAFEADTRALVNNTNDLGSQSATTGFGVFGYKTIGTVDTYVFNNQNVTAASEGSDGGYTWSYTPLKYWDMDAYYHFVAYWPHTTASGVVSNDETNHKLTLNISNWQLVNGSETDWLIDADEGDATDDYFGSSQASDNGTVFFNFEHLLALIEVKAWYYGNESKVPTITSLDFGSESYQVPSSDGTVNASRDYTTSSTTVWSTITKANSVQLAANSTLTAFSTDENGDNFFPPTTDGSVQEINTVCQWLVVPFATADCPMTVKYKIGDTGTVMEAVIDDTTFETLVSGKKYTLTLKFNTKTNTLDPISVLVRDWKDITVEDERYNW